MRLKTQKALRSVQARTKSAGKSIKKGVSPSWIEKQLVKIYLKGPQKLQYALARFGVNRVIKKKTSIGHIIKH